MNEPVAAAWGAFGGFAVEGVAFVAAMRQLGKWPWRKPGHMGAPELAVATLIRVVISGGVAAAACSTDQVVGAIGALVIGAGAMPFVTKAAQHIPLTPSSPEVDVRDSQITTLEFRDDMNEQSDIEEGRR